jgi:hypothetical protein
MAEMVILQLGVAPTPAMARELTEGAELHRPAGRMRLVCVVAMFRNLPRYRQDVLS